MGYGLRKPKCPVPGMDLVGRVDAFGRTVTRFQPGNEVFGTCEGSFAEYACAREDGLAAKPAQLTFQQAAVSVSGLAALQSVCHEGEVQAGQRVLIIGADHVIDYTREDIDEGGQRFDVNLDLAGNRRLSHLRRALTPRDTLVIVGGEEGGRWLGGVDRQATARPVLLGSEPRVMLSIKR